MGLSGLAGQGIEVYAWDFPALVSAQRAGAADSWEVCTAPAGKNRGRRNPNG